jgi:hypothetical protein
MPTVKGDCKKSTIIQQRDKWLANRSNAGKAMQLRER